jgi:glycosyltransferase involved in cell wall biosynthesis
MQTNPLVSILTPTYNHEKYIAECIASVQNQSYTNWEMIIVNDGSTDSTQSIAETFAANDPRIKIYKQENLGILQLHKTYNFALNKSTGKYIAVLEGDDIWFPEKLMLQVASLEKNENAVLSWGQAMSVSTDLNKNFGIVPNLKFSADIFTNSPPKVSLHELIFSNFLPALTVLIRKEKLVEIGGFIQNFELPLVDLPTWQRLSFLGPFCYINQPLGYWRTSPNQITKTHTIAMIEGVYQLALQLYKQESSYFNSLNISENLIHRHFRKRLIVNYCHAGNFCLTRKDYAQARINFYKSISSFGCLKISWKIRALWGILKSYIL